MTDAQRPRRSCLYMPGANERALEKAKSLDADVLLLDLEDAVAPDAKPGARDLVCKTVSEGGFGDREVVIRINGLTTEWGQDDLKAAVAAKPDAILFPKVSTAEEVTEFERLLDEYGAPKSLQIWAMIETPLAILNIAAIAETARSTRLSTFIMGTNDLAKEQRVSPTPDRLAFQTALSLTVMAARAHDVCAIDGVFNDIKNLDGLRAESEQGAVFGFDGKTLIHPAQIEICNEIFSPSDEEVSHAAAVVEAFADPENAGKGVIKVNGKMTELLHLEMAQRTLAIAAAIGKSPSND